MKIRYFGYSCLASALLLLAACASTPDASEAYKDQTAQQIFQGGEDALRDHSYSDAIKHFEALDVQYPFGRNTQTAQLHIIYAYYKNSDYTLAQGAADRYIHAYPTSPNVDYAYYLRGLSNYYQNMGVFERLFSVDFATRDLTQVKKSFNDFSELESRYPDSPYAPAAHQYMIYLRNVMARHQVEVAQFYYNHNAYVAASNRASIVIEHYQGAPVVPDALVILAKSYHQLKQFDLESQTVQVIRYNYPNSDYLSEVTGARINNQSYSLSSPKQNKMLAPQQLVAAPPIRDVASYQYNHMNGARGATTPVADLVKRTAPTGSTPPATAAKKTGKMTLGDLWKKLNTTNFFSLHSKPGEESQSDAAAAPTAPQTKIAPVQLAQNDYNGKLPDNGERR